MPPVHRPSSRASPLHGPSAAAVTEVSGFHGAYYCRVTLRYRSRVAHLQQHTGHANPQLVSTPVESVDGPVDSVTFDPHCSGSRANYTPASFFGDNSSRCISPPLMCSRGGRNKHLAFRNGSSCPPPLNYLERGVSVEGCQRNRDQWGRVSRIAVGAHLQCITTRSHATQMVLVWLRRFRTRKAQAPVRNQLRWGLSGTHMTQGLR